MKTFLIITDCGDPSVGIFETTHKVECPFNLNLNGEEYIDKKSVDYFQHEISSIYLEFSQGKITSKYVNLKE